MQRHLEPFLVAVGLAVASGLRADIPIDRQAMREEIVPHGQVAGASGTCSIVYYNLCSGWLWVWGGWVQGDEVGVVFDLPVDCDALPGETCTNTAFWWYWRYTSPGWGYTITYDLYRLDEQLCKLGPPLGTIAGWDPAEHWPLPLSFPGIELAGQVAIIASWDKGGLPRLATDNNNKNYGAPGSCPGYSLSPVHSFYWGGLTTQYCPPQSLNDNYGPVQLVMDASFSCEATSVQPSSWGAIKMLFR